MYPPVVPLPRLVGTDVEVVVLVLALVHPALIGKVVVFLTPEAPTSEVEPEASTHTYFDTS